MILKVKQQCDALYSVNFSVKFNLNCVIYLLLLALETFILEELNKRNDGTSPKHSLFY